MVANEFVVMSTAIKVNTLVVMVNKQVLQTVVVGVDKQVVNQLMVRSLLVILVLTECQNQSLEFEVALLTSSLLLT